VRISKNYQNRKLNQVSLHFVCIFTWNVKMYWTDINETLQKYCTVFQVALGKHLKSVSVSELRSLSPSFVVSWFILVHRGVVINFDAVWDFEPTTGIVWDFINETSWQARSRRLGSSCFRHYPRMIISKYSSQNYFRLRTVLHPLHSPFWKQQNKNKL